MLSLSYLLRPPVCPSLTKKEPVGANSPYQRLVPFLLSSQESGSSNGHLFCFIMLFIHYRITSHQHYKNVIFPSQQNLRVPNLLSSLWQIFLFTDLFSQYFALWELLLSRSQMTPVLSKTQHKSWPPSHLALQ